MLFQRKKLIILFSVILILVGLYILLRKNNFSQPLINITDNPNLENDGGLNENFNNLSIEALRNGEYPGSDIIIEQILESGSNYERYIASYKSEGLKIYALLTVPDGNLPTGGWPVIVFNHGYIPPAQYSTTERYIAYVDSFAKNGYIIFKPDYRGHGNSEGKPSGAYGSNNYTIDVLNAVSSIKKYKGVNPAKIGMWGHSMGGFLTLRSMVVSDDIRVGVIWAGVVGSYPDLLNNWRRKSSTPPPGIPSNRRRWREELTEQYGSPEQNPEFWNSISANTYLTDISGPIQLHHGTSDASVPIEFSQKLESQLTDAGKESELYIYQGDNHNLSNNFSLAMQRSLEFFNKYLKI